MNKQDCIELQQKLNALGAGLKVDGVYGPKTQAAEAKYLGEKPAALKPENPAYREAKKHAGKTEFMAAFRSFLVPFWSKVGLPGYKTLIGTSFAWCGLFIAAMNTETGLSIVKGAAGARNWAKSGVAIDWRANGIPRGAVMHINGNGNCSSGSGNHVTFADGDCTVEDLARLKQVPGYGGNQGNAVKRSMYPVKNVCAVRWPAEIEKPGPVLQSFNCAGGGSSGESTR